MENNTLTKLREVQLELLDKFAHICEENNLVYFLTGGTLLGAVRHKGYIPWDDDIDVAMPREDYEKILDISDNSKDPDYYMLSYRSTVKAGDFCRHFAKFCKTDTVFAESYRNPDSYPGIFIDIFPLDNCILFFVPLQTILVRIIRKLYLIKIHGNIPKKKSVLFIAKLLNCFFPLKFLDILHRKLHLLFNKHTTKYMSFFSGRYVYKKEVHRYDEIFPLDKVLFEGKNYSAPGNWDSFLKILFDNYMELPPVEKRGSHAPLYIKVNGLEYSV